MNNCLECGKETNNPKFCSKSCSIRYWNRERPKRKSNNIRICPVCGGKKGYQSEKCKKCRNRERIEDALCKPIKEHYNSNTAVKYNSIREWARKIMEDSKKKKECEICGFDLYVEVCHKKPISTFSDETLLSVVNDLDNLIYLCPNHHVMLDKGFLDIRV